MKVLSAAVFFTDNRHFLAVHPTNHLYTFWDLPKGLCEKDENNVETAIREFKEETGVTLNKTNIRYINIYPLHETKNILLFLYQIPELPPITSLKCVSTTKAYGTPVPEIDNYNYFKLSEYTKLRKELHKPIKELLDKILNNQF